MEYTPSLDYTTEFTHYGRVDRNTSTEYLNKHADETRNRQFEIENNKSNFSLKYGLVDQDPSTTEEALKEANDNKYDEARYSGIATRVVPLNTSATIIHDTLPKVYPTLVSSKPKNNINRIRANSKLLPPISSSIIRNNPDVIHGIFRDDTIVNSKTVIYGNSESKIFGKISNKDSKTNKTVSIDKPPSSPPDPIPDRIISTKKPLPFGIIINGPPRLSTINRNTNDLQRRSQWIMERRPNQWFNFFA